MKNEHFVAVVEAGGTLTRKNFADTNWGNEVSDFMIAVLSGLAVEITENEQISLTSDSITVKLNWTYFALSNNNCFSTTLDSLLHVVYKVKNCYPTIIESNLSLSISDLL